MEYTYVQLGILQKAFDYCYDHILSPAFNFISNLMKQILTPLFENFFLPLLEMHFKITIGIVKALLENYVYNLLFRVARILLWILDAIEKIFRTFAGLNPVYVRDESGRLKESGSLLLTLAMNRYIRTALLAMIMVAFVLCFLMALFATIRSAGDLEGKRPVGKVMRMTAQALLKLILIPIMSLGLIVLGDAVFKSIEIATNQTRTPVSNILFTMSTLDAVREKDYPDAVYYNSSTRSAALAKNKAAASQVADYGMQDKYRKPWYLGHKDRDDMVQVLETFDIRRMDYIILVGLTAIFIFIFGLLAVNMSARIFDCLVLLLVEPFFAASIPLDEGEKFEKWKDIFLGRLVSGYGSVVAMNLYLSIISMIFSGKINFFGPGTTPGVEYLVKVLFVLIGAWTIVKAGPVVTGIMSAQGGAREAEVTKKSTELTGQAAAFVMKPFTWTAKTLAGRGFEALKEGVSNLTNGGFGNGGGGGAGVAPAGTGAFGQLTGTGPTGVQFSGYRTPGGMAMPGYPGGVYAAPGGYAGTGSGGAGPTGVQFGGRKNADGRTINGSGGGGAGSTPGGRRSGAGMQSMLGGAGSADDGFETVFDIGDGTLFDEPGGEDGFDTVFDVGGSNLFDEDYAGPTQAFGGSSANKRHSYSAPKMGLDVPNAGLPGAGIPGAGIPGAGQGRSPYDFLQAGSAPGTDNLGGYTWIGQEDQKEREEKKEYEEQLLKDMDSASLDAAESSTGMDLNGDGQVEGDLDFHKLFGDEPAGSINDTDEEDL